MSTYEIDLPRIAALLQVVDKYLQKQRGVAHATPELLTAMTALNSVSTQVDAARKGASVTFTPEATKRTFPVTADEALRTVRRLSTRSTN